MTIKKEWNGEYPIWINGEFIADDEAFYDWIRHEDEPDFNELIVHPAKPTLASDVITVQNNLDREDGNDDLPPELDAYIKLFEEGLKAFKEPLSYSEDTSVNLLLIRDTK